MTMDDGRWTVIFTVVRRLWSIVTMTGFAEVIRLLFLTDTGPIVALINRHDPNHQRCVEAAKQLPAGPMVTTWPCFTEAMYLLFQAGGHPAQAELWRWRTAGRMTIFDALDNDMDRMANLMDKYKDTPMDLADASIVAAVERLGLRRVFTLDSDFYIYRLLDDSALQCVP